MSLSPDRASVTVGHLFHRCQKHRHVSHVYQHVNITIGVSNTKREKWIIFQVFLTPVVFLTFFHLPLSDMLCETGLTDGKAYSAIQAIINHSR